MMLHPFILAQWVQTNGPSGGAVYALAVSGQSVFAATAAGVFLSSNNGTNWTAVNTGVADLGVYALAVTRSNLFAGTGAGIYLSTDSGLTWTAVNTSLKFDGQWIFGVSDSILFVGTPSGAFRSTDAGARWTAINDGLTNPDVRAFAARGMSLFAGIYGGGVFLSTNYGTNWTAVNSGLTDLHVLSLAAGDKNLFAGTSSRVCVSTNNGSSWSELSTSPTTVDALLARGDTTLYALKMYGGVSRSTDGGNTWMAINGGLPTSLALPVFPVAQRLVATDTNLFLGTEHGIYRWSNNGGSWTESNSGLTNTSVVTFALSGSTVLAGTWYDGMFTTTDNGERWKAANIGLPYAMDLYPPIEASAVNGMYAFVGTSANPVIGHYGGLYRSSNSGASWTEVKTGLPANASVIAFAVSGANIFAGTVGVYLSTNNGTTWTGTGFSGAYVTSFAMGGGNLFAGTYDGVRLSTDNGASWTAVNAGLPQDNLRQYPWVVDLAVTGTNICAGANFYSGIFLSTNGGTSWRAVKDGLPDNSVRAFATSGSYLFAGCTKGGVFLSANHGESWKAVSTGLMDAPVNALAVSDSYLLAGVGYGGVWRRPVSEMIQTSVEATSSELPAMFKLEQNYPNPFNPNTTIKYELPRVSHVTLKVFNVLAQEMVTLVDALEEPGYKSVQWNPSTGASGLYFYRLTAGNFLEVKKMLLVR